MEIKKNLTTKGQKTVEKIITAGIELIQSDGVAAASQEAIAKKAGISQSSLRHHFKTKDSLILTIFTQLFQEMRVGVDKLIMQPYTDPKQRILEIAKCHLDYIKTADDVYSFAAMAYISRTPELQSVRQEWINWLIGHYAALLKQIKPDMEQSEADNTAMIILNACLGGWFTFSKNAPIFSSVNSRTDVMTLLLDHIKEIIRNINRTVKYDAHAILSTSQEELV